MNWTDLAIELGIIIGLATIICGLMFAIQIPFVTTMAAKVTLSITALVLVTSLYMIVKMDWITNPFVIAGYVITILVIAAITSVMDEKKQQVTPLDEEETWHAEG
ncbi:hypothetical protein D3D03_07725 [Exiguobacterium sp. RIT452]|uniref:hypothetical protein n=1 Tax=Exiguobacterium sp. RIT452 TaxID=2315552 RepID=UPI000E71D1BF|nr:hypothetical protein [Exiguobacterium sp. RIT452]RJP00672.1 hypothetical protein D3D03_07725 [Exiguobacterium sp. RIT452]